MEKEQVIKKILQEKEISEKSINDVFSFYKTCREWVFSSVKKKGKCDFTEAACFMYSIIYNDVIEDLEKTCDLALECGLTLIEHPKHTILDELLNTNANLPTFALKVYKKENLESYSRSCLELYQDIRNNNRLAEDFNHMSNFASCVSILIDVYQMAIKRETTCDKKEK